MRLRDLFRLAGLLTVAALLWPHGASADLKLCNRTSYIIYSAVGAATKAELDVQGWTRIEPGDCATPIAEPLKAPAYFMYGRASRAYSGLQRAWGGNIRICARDTNFSIRMKLPVQGCPGGEFYKMPFAVIDRHGKSDWTTTFTESGNLKSLKDAKHAGLNRLLESLGYHVNVPGERARDLALDDIHRRLKLAADANDSELFDAMETEALKGAAPAGYTVCNNTDSTLWAAIGVAKGKTVVSRGWWQIAAGACSRVINEPLATDRVYLLAQGKGRHPIVSGATKLCVTDGEFELPANDRCDKPHQHGVGFAKTDTKGRQGYVAKVRDTGLLPPEPATQKAGATARNSGDATASRLR